MSNHQQLNRIAPWVIQNKRTVVLGLVAVMIATGGFYVIQKNRQNKRVFLFGGHAFNEFDLNRMQIAFGKSGLNDFKIERGRMSVPQIKRDEYLKSLDKHAAIPQEFARQNTPSPLTNLLPREERLRRQHQAKKERLERLISKMNFVQQAWVEYDELKTSGIKPQVKRSVVVAIRCYRDQFLTRSQFKTIRQLVIGAIAGVDEDDVVISDVNANISVSGGSVTSGSTPESRQLIVNEITNLIRQKLARFGEINIEVADATNDTESKSLETQQILSAGANQPISIEPQEKPDANANIESIRILIGVDQAALQYWLQSRGQSMSQIKPENAFNDMKRQILDLTRQIITTQFPKYGCTVAVIPDSEILQSKALGHSNDLNVSELTQWIKQNWLTLSVILGGMICVLLLIRRSDSKQPSRETTPSSAIPNSANAGIRTGENKPVDHSVIPLTPELSQELPVDRRLQQEVVDLIKQNPEHATEILKDWIKEAA